MVNVPTVVTLGIFGAWVADKYGKRLATDPGSIVNPLTVSMLGISVFFLVPIFVVLAVPQSYWNPFLPGFIVWKATGFKPF